MKKSRVFIAMSGGVDSSVAAALLKKRGFNVVGVHMRCYNVDGCAARDAEDARRAAEVLGIPFYVFDFEKEYKDRVVNYMIDGYRKGITPNPDVMCNKEIKFGLFLKKALSLGADYIATGHYVRLPSRKISVSSTRFGRSSGGLRLSSQRRGFDKTIISKPPSSPAPEVSDNRIFSLQAAKDKNKDQSYFLWTLTQDQLRHCLFPIGEYKKPQVRKLAKKFGLLNAEKKDSQGICFLGQVDLPDFLKKYIKPKKGPIVIASSSASGGVSRPSLRGAKRRGNLTGKFVQIGTHNGTHFYTIGQRHGLSVGGFPRPLYVADKNVKKNIVMVAEGENEALYKKEVVLTNVNLIEQLTNHQLTVYVRVRYRQPLSRAKVIIEKNQQAAKLIFTKPIKFVAEGQSAVFYRARRSLGKGGYEMLGGGIIKSAI